MIQIAIAVVQHGDRFLIGQRSEGVPLAGLWEFPGGKLLPDESPATAAARECLEETGLSVQVGEAYPAVVHDYDHGRLQLHFFSCTPHDSGRMPRAPFRWIARAELAKYEFPPANRGLIAYLLADASGS